jgi:hypothetical protein
MTRDPRTMCRYPWFLIHESLLTSSYPCVYRSLRRRIKLPFLELLVARLFHPRPRGRHHHSRRLHRQKNDFSNVKRKICEYPKCQHSYGSTAVWSKGCAQWADLLKNSLYNSGLLFSWCFCLVRLFVCSLVPCSPFMIAWTLSTCYDASILGLRVI